MANLSAKRGGSVKGISGHCRWLRHRPVFLSKSILCSGGEFWKPCSDLTKCRGISPPLQYLKPLVIDVFEEVIQEVIQHKKKHATKTVLRRAHK